MKPKLIILAMSILFIGMITVCNINPVEAKGCATCSATGTCNACKNCKYCKNCNENKGTCSVCK
jgi:hypothetical protein